MGLFVRVGNIAATVCACILMVTSTMTLQTVAAVGIHAAQANYVVQESASTRKRTTLTAVRGGLIYIGRLGRHVGLRTPCFKFAQDVPGPPFFTSISLLRR